MNYGEEAAKQEAATKYAQNRMMSGISNATIGQSTQEPTLSNRLKELRSLLCELGEIQQSQRMVLMGPEPTDPSLAKASHEPSIEEMLCECCNRAAVLVSEARSIRNRM